MKAYTRKGKPPVHVQQLLSTMTYDEIYERIHYEHTYIQISLNIIDIICLRIFLLINKKICRQKMSIIFNEICINEEMQPIYTYLFWME